MGERRGVFARQWSARRAPGASPEEVAEPTDQVLLTAAMTLLSDYEDAIYAMCRHALVPAETSLESEASHMVEAARLHADVRRLRVEVLAMMDPSAGEEERADR